MKEITYKQVLDTEGFLTGLELWQDGAYITISLGHADASYRSGYKWTEMRKTIDRLQETAAKDVLHQAGGDEYFKTLKAIAAPVESKE